MMLGCSTNPSLDSLRAGTGGLLAKVNVAEFDRPPAPAPQYSPDVSAADSGKGKYDFSVEEVHFRESAFLSNGSEAPSVKFVAKNNGFAPVSVTIVFDQDLSQNAAWDANKSHTTVVPPHSTAEIGRVDPKNNIGHWKLVWDYTWQIGDYTTRHNCKEGYRFPVSDAVSAYASVAEERAATPFTRNALAFRMPADAKVLAARKGTVVRIAENNDVDVLHDDSTIATYSHLETTVKDLYVGKAVNVGDPVGFAGKGTDTAYMQLAVWRPEPQVTANVEKIDRSTFRAVSFPLEFCTDGNHCRELKVSQSITQNAAIPAASTQPAAKTERGPYDFSVKTDQLAEPSFLTDGSTSTRLIAVNRGYAPVSVLIDCNAGSDNIRPNVPLPHSAVVPPQSELVLASLSPVDRHKGMTYSWQYTWQLGDLAADHHSQEHYRYPFAGNVRAYAHVSANQSQNAYGRYLVTFSLPVGTKVLAARSGIVVRVKKNNDIDVLHNDSTIATYSHLGGVETGIAEGKSVSAGEVLGVAGSLGKTGETFVHLSVWRPEQMVADSSVKGATTGIQPVSFPMEFCSDAQDCKVLTSDQQITGKSSKKKQSKKLKQ